MAAGPPWDKWLQLTVAWSPAGLARPGHYTHAQRGFSLRHTRHPGPWWPWQAPTGPSILQRGTCVCKDKFL